MRRWASASIIGIALVTVAQPALALVYVPGQYREDGVYIRPHFERPDHRIGDAWLKDLANPVAAQTGVKLPPAGNDAFKDKSAPGAAR